MQEGKRVTDSYVVLAALARPFNQLPRRRTAMLKQSVIVCLAVVLVAAAPAYAQVIHQVHVGGPDVCAAFDLPSGCDKNFSVVGLEFANGRMAGQYTDRWGGFTAGVAGNGFHAAIDCVLVDGNQAWVSGVITKGKFGDVDLAGLPVVTRVRDNGASQNDPPDEISFSWIDIGLTCMDRPDLPLYAFPQGQVAVK
jgi:hypothetical protein